MRLWPKNSNEVNVGIGDFFAYGGDPTERLHVRDGRLRIQQLPDNPEADHDFKVMVVDNSNDPLERGVVKWKDPSQLGGSGCDWTIQNNGISGPAVAHSVFTAVGSSDLCPDDADAVGIGTNSPKAKLHVVTGTPWFFGNDVILGQLRTNAGGGRAVHGSAMATSSYSFSPNEFIGVKGAAGNGKYTYGVNGEAENTYGSPGIAQDVIGVRGRAKANGNATRVIGVYGSGSGADSSNHEWGGYFEGRGFLGLQPGFIRMPG